MIGRAGKRGVNFIDTADVYSAGQSEMMTGQAIKDIGVERKDVVLATKVFSRMGDGPNDIGASRGHIMDAVSAAWSGWAPITSTSTRSTTDLVTPVEETVRALDDLVSPGHGALRRLSPTGRPGG